MTGIFVIVIATIPRGMDMAQKLTEQWKLNPECTILVRNEEGEFKLGLEASGPGIGRWVYKVELLDTVAREPKESLVTRVRLTAYTKGGLSPMLVDYAKEDGVRIYKILDSKFLCER